MKIRSPLLTRLAGWLAAAVVRALAATVRVIQLHDTPQTEIDAPGVRQAQFLWPMWHDMLLVGLVLRLKIRDTTSSALVSRHQDGSYLTAAMEHIDIRPIRGSSSRGGAQAVRQLLSEAGQRNIVVTPDGPRGPRRQLKDGIIYLSSQTGLPIVPLAFACPRAWRIQGSWTDLVIPRPFSTVRLLVGVPVTIPPGLSRHDLAGHRQRVQAAMDQLHERASALENGTPPAAQRLRPAA